MTLQKKAKSFQLLAQHMNEEKRGFWAGYVTGYMYEAKYTNQYDSFKKALSACLSWIADSAIAESAIPLSEELKELRIRICKPILEKAMQEVLSLLSRELHYTSELEGQRFYELTKSLISQIYT